MKCFARLFSILLTLFIPVVLFAHFQVVLPSQDFIESGDNNAIIIELLFCHPFEGDIMEMARPKIFGVLKRGQENEDLLGRLVEKNNNNFTYWEITYQIKKPGDHIFYVEPMPYWEPAEGKFIIHYTKAVVNGFGLESGWDAKVGSKMEIIPLVRPYGLYKGNLFRGIVLIDGKPAPFIDIEVEYYNENNKYQAPASPFITQVIRSDMNGVFSYAMPFAGWWGFAALYDSDEELMNPEDGKYYPVELGGLFWVKTADIK